MGQQPSDDPYVLQEIISNKEEELRALKDKHRQSLMNTFANKVSVSPPRSVISDHSARQSQSSARPASNLGSSRPAYPNIGAGNVSAIDNPNHTTFSIPSMLHQHQMIDSTRITNLDSILEDSFKTKNILTNSLINIPR